MEEVVGEEQRAAFGLWNRCVFESWRGRSLYWLIFRPLSSGGEIETGSESLSGRVAGRRLR